MNGTALTAISTTGFTVAFLHAAIPTHWLPFVLTGRVQRWSRAKTLFVTALAGCGHVLFTAVLGFLVAWGGIALSERIGGLFPWIAGGALIAFGLYYVIQQLRGKGHGHTHVFGGHSHDHEADTPDEHVHAQEHHAEHECGPPGHHGHEHTHDHDHDHETIADEIAHTTPPPLRSDWAAIMSLLALLTFSPCEGFIPVYVSGVRYGWGGFFLLTLILSVATVAGMIVFTWLTLAGMEKLKLGFIEKYESGVLGGLLCVLGLLIIIFEH